MLSAQPYLPKSQLQTGCNWTFGFGMLHCRCRGIHLVSGGPHCPLGGLRLSDIAGLAATGSGGRVLALRGTALGSVVTYSFRSQPCALATVFNEEWSDLAAPPGTVVAQGCWRHSARPCQPWRVPFDLGGEAERKDVVAPEVRVPVLQKPSGEEAGSTQGPAPSLVPSAPHSP